MNTPLVVGIDLGTTNSLAAYVKNGKPECVRDSQGIALVPSCIAFAPDGTVTVGAEAKARALADPTHTVFSVKRLMGRTLAELKDDLPHIPHQLLERQAMDGRAVLRVKFDNAEYTPEELSALILKEVRTRAGNPTKAVITVPAYFDDTQRQATRDAGRIAGLEVLRIINEPTAAALAYGLDRTTAAKVVVYDLGGGTFDCSVLSLTQGVFQVLSTHGDTRLGGDDFDRALTQYVLKDIGPVDMDAVLLQHLRAAAETCKHALSTQDSATLTVTIPERGIAWNKTITRVEFETAITPLVDRTLSRCKMALKDAGLTANQIDEVVLVGGSTRVPFVRQKVKEFFGKEPKADLNPDEVVALGAAVQADILAGNRKDLTLLDVVPLSLGIETMGGVVDKVIYRNTAVPCKATQRYTTYADNQTAIVVNIYQGERELTKDCRLLGAFKLGGIPPLPAQMAQMDVTFLVDENGMLTVSAVEQRSGQTAKVEVKAAHGLSQSEVEKLVLESVDNAREDFRARQWIEYKNKAEADLRHARKAMAQVGHELNDAEKAEIQAAQSAVEEALKAEDSVKLPQTVDAFGTATAKLAERLMNANVRAMLKGKTEHEVKG